MNKLPSPIVLLATVAAAPVLADEIASIDAAEFAWQVTPESVAFAPAQGGRCTNTYRATGRFSSSTTNSPHVKSLNMLGAVLMGEPVDPQQRAALSWQYWSVPKHILGVPKALRMSQLPWRISIKKAYLPSFWCGKE
jgi:hypothetical protein